MVKFSCVEYGETVFTMCDVCEREIEVPLSVNGSYCECPKCHNYTTVELTDEEIQEQLEER